MILRDYQRDIFGQLTASHSNDIVQLDTGAGKTPIEAEAIEEHPAAELHPPDRRISHPPRRKIGV